MRKRLEREKGYMAVNVPHITTLAIQAKGVCNFIENH